MKSTPKLSSEERREAIIKAVRKLFAEKGFHGTTTRELARAAGVSEALLFKHFPNKEALYSAMMFSCKQERDVRMFERVKALEPSALTLVLMVHTLVAHLLSGRSAGDRDERAIHNRLMLQSLLEDGEFARFILQRVGSHWVAKVEECIKAAIAAGEAIDGAVQPNLRGWFAHHLTALTMMYLLPENPVVNYGMSREKLVEQAVWFALRGMGLKEEAIRRYYNPKALELFAD